MASCAGITLSIEGSKLFADNYVLKMYLSEGISMPPLAKLTLISQQKLSPSALKSLLGKRVRIALIQATVASKAIKVEETESPAESVRYVHGCIINISFIQKVSREVTSEGKLTTVYSNVYEVSVASVFYQLQAHVSCELLKGTTPSEVLKGLLACYANNGDNFGYDASKFESGGNEQASSSIVDFSSVLALYSQDNENAYALLQRLLCLAQANFCFAHLPNDFKEQVFVAAGLNFSSSSDSDDGGDNNIAQLYSSNGTALTLENEFDLDQADSEIADFTYSCTQCPPLGFTSIISNNNQDSNLSLTEQLLRSDPFLQWLCPVQLNRNSKDSAYIFLLQRLSQIKSNQQLLQGEEISANACNLAFQPYMSFTLKGADDDDDLKLMVRRVELVAVAPFPTDRAYPAPTHAEKILQLRLTLLNEASFKDGYGCLLESSQLMSPELMFDFHALDLFAQTRVTSAFTREQGTGLVGANLGAATQGEGGQGSTTSQGAMLSLEHAIGGLNELQALAIAKRHSENQPQLVTATVCTNTGTAQDNSASKKDWTGKVFLVDQDNLDTPMLIYARLNDTQKVVVVELLNDFSVGGFVPRVGSQIKVLISHGQYLCLGQVSTAYNVFDEEQRQRNLYSRRWCNVKDDKEIQVNQSVQVCGNAIQTYGRDVKSESDTIYESAVGLEYFDNAFDEIVFHYEHGSLDQLAFNQAVMLNSASMLSKYQSAKKDLDTAYTTMCSAQNAYEAAHQAYFAALAGVTQEHKSIGELGQDRQKSSNAYVDAYNDFYQKVGEVREILQLENKSGKMQSYLYARKGEVQLNSAQGNISLLSQKLNTAADVTNLSGKTIKISADDKLVLAVGGNAISLDRNGIAIESRKWTGVSGMLDSLILLDSISGVSIAGLNANISGVLGVNLSDRFGGKVGITNGSCKIGGMNCSMGASVGARTVTDLVNFALSSANEIVNMGLTLGKVQNSSTYNAIQSEIYYGSSDIINLCFSGYGLGKNIRGFSDSKTKKGTVSAIIDLLNDIVSIIILLIASAEHVMMAFFKGTLNQIVSKSTPNYTVRDMIRTLSSGLKLVITVTNVINMMAITGLKSKAASISCIPEKLHLDANTINSVSQEAVEAQNPVAGNADTVSDSGVLTSGDSVPQPTNASQ